MAQDDAHIYCTPEQLDGELERFIDMTREVYAAFGFERVSVTLQTRPEQFLGRVELWDAADQSGADERTSKCEGHGKQHEDGLSFSNGQIPGGEPQHQCRCRECQREER